jgi:Arc/MetJ-type ribon-helix-helix transcriptional regulator
MPQKVTISVKVPKDIHAELAVRIPEGERSSFIRDAIAEKLQKTPRPEKILELEQKIQKIEGDISTIKACLADLELLTYERGRVNPHAFCVDKTDHAIVDYLIHYKGATTTELAERLKENRWLILNRLKRIKRRSKKQLGKPAVEYFSGEKAGKRRAWWLEEELIEKR